MRTSPRALLEADLAGHVPAHRGGAAAEGPLDAGPFPCSPGPLRGEALAEKFDEARYFLSRMRATAAEHRFGVRPLAGEHEENFVLHAVRDGLQPETQALSEFLGRQEVARQFNAKSNARAVVIATDDGSRPLTFDFRAFVTAAQSVQQHVKEAAKSRRVLKTYDALCDDPLLKFFKDLRTSSSTGGRSRAMAK